MPAPYPQEFRDDVVRVARNREPGQRLSAIAKDITGAVNVPGGVVICGGAGARTAPPHERDKTSRPRRTTAPDGEDGASYLLITV